MDVATFSPFETFCKSSQITFYINVVAVILQISFVVSLAIFLDKQKELERAANGKKNVMTPLIFITMYGTILAIVVFLAVAVMQGRRIFGKAQ